MCAPLCPPPSLQITVTGNVLPNGAVEGGKVTFFEEATGVSHSHPLPPDRAAIVLAAPHGSIRVHRDGSGALALTL